MVNSGTFYGRARVSVVDDDEVARQLFKDILQSRDSFTFTGGFSSGKEAMTAIPHLRPDLVLVDISLPDMDGIDCTEQLRRLVPGLRVVIVSGNRDVTSFERSCNAGAATYLIKPVDPDQLIASLHLAVVRKIGRNLIGSRRNTGIASGALSGQDLPLSPREEEVMSGLADGLLYKEISDKLGISFAAVHKHSHNIYKKLGASNRSEAIRGWLGV